MKRHYIKEDFVSSSDISDFLDRAIPKLIDDDFGCATYKLDGSFAICVGWSEGCDPDDTDAIHSQSDPTYCLVAGIKVWTSDSMRTDYDYINYPYYEDGTVIDNDVILSYEDDTEEVATELIKMYNSLNNIEVTEEGRVIVIKDDEKNEDLTEAKKGPRVKNPASPTSSDMTQGQARSQSSGNFEKNRQDYLTGLKSIVDDIVAYSIKKVEEKVAEGTGAKLAQFDVDINEGKFQVPAEYLNKEDPKYIWWQGLKENPDKSLYDNYEVHMAIANAVEEALKKQNGYKRAEVTVYDEGHPNYFEGNIKIDFEPTLSKIKNGIKNTFNAIKKEIKGESFELSEEDDEDILDEDVESKLTLPEDDDNFFVTPVPDKEGGSVRAERNLNDCVRKTAREVIASYQNANRWLDTVKEVVYTKFNCPFFSSYIHKLAHTMPERFDRFGDILHTLNLEIEYPATAELTKKPQDIGQAFAIIFSILNDIKDRLTAFIKCTDEDNHGMSCATEACLNDIEQEYPALYRLQAIWQECGDMIEFDKYVGQYVEHKDKLVEDFETANLSNARQPSKLIIPDKIKNLIFSIEETAEVDSVDEGEHHYRGDVTVELDDVPYEDLATEEEMLKDLAFFANDNPDDNYVLTQQVIDDIANDDARLQDFYDYVNENIKNYSIKFAQDYANEYPYKFYDEIKDQEDEVKFRRNFYIHA